MRQSTVIPPWGEAYCMCFTGRTGLQHGKLWARTERNGLIDLFDQRLPTIEIGGPRIYLASIVPRREALRGRTLESRKTSSRLPAIASPSTSSAAPSPYILAVWIWFHPSSRRRRSAAVTQDSTGLSRRQ